MALEARSSESAEILTLIVDAFEGAQKPGLPKLTQLSDAILGLISSGKLKEDTKLPGERELSAALNISLGTVQRSLNRLMTDGDLVRQHGRGTFVRQNRKALNELWHYRFRDNQTGALMPVYAKVISREVIAPDDNLTQRLGPSTAGYIRISRLIRIGEDFECWSDIFMSASTFKKLQDVPVCDLENANLKQLLNDKFNAPTLSTEQTIMIRNASAKIAKLMNIPPKTACMFLQIVARSRRNKPITFQQIYVPPVEFELELLDGASELAKVMAA